MVERCTEADFWCRCARCNIVHILVFALRLIVVTDVEDVIKCMY